MRTPGRWVAGFIVGIVTFLLLQGATADVMRLLWGGGPGVRSLYLKLPLDQTRFHWKFSDEEALLGGSLEIEVHGAAGRDTVVTVFREGRFAPGWRPIDTSVERGEIYFGFIGDVDVWTHRKDSVVIRLEAAEDLDGIGPYARGVLRRGQYESTASYRVLTGHPGISFMPQRANPRASIGCWRTKWELDIVEEEGWSGVREEDADPRSGGWLGEVFAFSAGNRGTDGYRCVE